MPEKYGPMAEAMFTAIRRAEQMQASTLEHIHSQYSTPDKPKSLYEMTFEDFVQEIDKAYANGTIDELNSKYVPYLIPIIQQIISPQPQQ